MNYSIDYLKGCEETYKLTLNMLNNLLKNDSENPYLNLLKTQFEFNLSGVKIRLKLKQTREKESKEFKEYLKEEERIKNRANHPNIIRIK